MYDSLKILNARTDHQGNVLGPVSPVPPEPARGFKVLADDFEHAIACLREEVTGLDGLFGLVLRPGEPTVCDTYCTKDVVRAPLESWLSTHLDTVNSCLMSIRNYKERCAL